MGRADAGAGRAAASPSAAGSTAGLRGGASTRPGRGARPARLERRLTSRPGRYAPSVAQIVAWTAASKRCASAARSREQGVMDDSASTISATWPGSRRGADSASHSPTRAADARRRRKKASLASPVAASSPRKDG